MSELNYLQFQTVDPALDDTSNGHFQKDDIDLDEQIDENTLENYWEKVVEDIHQDPDWFTFSEE